MSEEALLLDDLPVVEAAALRVQTLKDAPANVTVVTAAEIRTFGYRTLAEILDSVRGFYVSSDHAYRYAGVRGLSLPGDYNTRFLVMINGHPMTENIYNSNGFFGQDFGLDMQLIERVEIIRGPTSALYGSNGVLATINVVTKSAVDHPGVQVSVELGSFGEKKTGFVTSGYLGKGVNLLLSASVFHTAGQSMFLTGRGERTGIDGTVDRLGAENGYHSFTQLTWGNWTASAFFNSRRVLLPHGLWGGLFNDPGSDMKDQRGFVSLDYSRQLGVERRLRWRTAYDQYRYRDTFMVEKPEEEVGRGDIRDSNWGDWLTTRLSLSTPVGRIGTFTAGTEVYQEIRNLQVAYTTLPVPQETLRIAAPNKGVALFVQQEIPISRRLTLYGGLRQDYSKNFGWFAAPRVAAVFSQNASLTYKASYSRAFRNPSTYEKYYEVELYEMRNLELRQERSHVFEGSVERGLGKRGSLIVSGFHYRMGDIIRVELTEGGRIQARNTGALALSGIESEVSGSAFDWLNVSVSGVLQASRDVQTSRRLVNSPSTLGKARVSVPVAKGRGNLHFAMRSWSSRTSGGGDTLPAVALFDAGVTLLKLRSGMELSAGARNLLARHYEDPVDLTFDRVRANGRTWFLRMGWRSSE